MAIIYEIDVLIEDLIFMFSIFGQIYRGGLWLTEYNTCVYSMQDSTNNKSMYEYYLWDGWRLIVSV